MSEFKNLGVTLDENHCTYQVTLDRVINVHKDERITYDFYSFEDALKFVDKAIKDPKVDYVSLSCFKFKTHDYDTIFGGKK